MTKLFYSYFLLMLVPVMCFPNSDLEKIEKKKYVKKVIPTLKEHKKTENFVKKLEYQTHYSDNSVVPGSPEVVAIDLNLIPDKRLADDVEDSLDEEFALIDKELGDEPDPPTNKSSKYRNNRQMSIMYQGVYAPDSRFNAFVDGVMVNMVVEMRRKKMDPLYFRVYDRGVIEHVPTRSNRQGRSADETKSNRTGRTTRGSAIGGGVVRGLTKIKRFGNAEVQVAGNTTLVRSHYMFGPLNIELVFDTPVGVKTVNSTLSALAGHSLAEVVSNNSSKHLEFMIDSPLEYQIDLVGAKSETYKKLSRSAIMRLYKPEGRMERRLKQCMARASQRPIPDVTKNNRLNRKLKNARLGRKGRKMKKEKKEEQNEELSGVPLDMDSINEKIISDKSIGGDISFRV